MSSLFEQLKPLCVHLTKNPSRAKLAELHQMLLGVDREILQGLQEYILFPLRLVFKQPTKCSHDVYIDTFACMTMVVSKSHITKWDVFNDFFCMACIQLSSPADQGRVADIPEELKLGVIHFLRAMIKSAEFSVLENLYSPTSLPVLGHCVSVLLNMAEKESLRALKITSMEFLLDLSGANGKYCQSVRVRLGDTFASFLPGISVTLGRIITGDSKQGNIVVITALEVWYSIVRLVMEDVLLQKAHAIAKPSHNVSEKLQGLVITRSPSWIEQTSNKLKLLVTHISSVRGHSKWKVRACLVDWAGCLLNHCSKSLQTSVPTILEILVGLSNDEYPAVAAKSRGVLEKYSRSRSEADRRPLVEILEENLHGLFLSLPRHIRMTDESEKLAQIRLLTGYLTLLGPNVKRLLLSLPHLKRLSLALVQVLELDTTDIKMVEERNQLTGTGKAALENVTQHHVVKPRKYFRLVHSEVLIGELQSVCRLLGYYGDLHILIDHFLDMFTDDAYKMAATLILNEIMVGAAGLEVSLPMNGKAEKTCHRSEELESIVKMLLEEYLSVDNMQLRTNMSSQSSDTKITSMMQELHMKTEKTKLADINKNVLQTCLYLEGIGNFAKVLGKHFAPFLIDVLYPLMEKLGDETAYINSSAYIALCDICWSCDYRSLGDLIRGNIDYIMNAISLRLRHFKHKRRCPLVLKVILEYSEADVLLVVEDTINEILLCMDDYYDDEAVMFMGVLHELAKAITRWFQSEQKLKERVDTTKPRHVQPSLQSTVESIKAFYLDYHRQKELADGGIDPSLIEGEPGPAEDETDNTEACSVDEQKEPPKHVLVIKEIMLRCKHLLSSHNPRLRLKVLDTVSYCVKALYPHQDSLLPLVHEIWQPFSLRFIDEEKLVIVKAVETLSILALVSGDFIRSRTMKDILPKVSQFLKKQAEISVSTGPAYLHTSSFKLQLALLSQLGQIAQKIGVEENDADIVAMAYLPYLSARQPLPLQEAAVLAFKILSDLEPDSMWLKLNYLYSPKVFSSPWSCFPSVTLSAEVGRRNEFTDNVLKLLQMDGSDLI